MHLLRIATLCLIIIGSASCGKSSDTEVGQTDEANRPDSHARSYEAAVASAHPRATEAGIKILNEGGNAFDAAVAVSAALAVVEPYSSGIGGGGFWLLHIASENRDVVIDGRERAPFAATRDMYLDEQGDVRKNASIDGALAAGIPGVPAALEHLAVSYGRFPLLRNLESAIELAEKGFEVDEIYQRMARFRLTALQSSFAASEIFLRDDQPPEIGDVIVQKDLADTLKIIGNKGANGFYRGALAQKLVDSVRQNGGIWTMEDMLHYGVIERLPIIGDYRGMRVVSVPPPSSGGVALVEIFNLLDRFELEQKSVVEQTHAITEAMRLAYRDRAEYLGDTDFVDVPIKRLTSKQHAINIGSDFDPSRATGSDELKSIINPTGDGTDTTHYSIVDSEGNMVSATLSINYPFGSGFVAEGTGVLLNDEMDDFVIKPNVPNVYGLVGGEANAIEPGKRMLSSMSPTFLETDDRIAVLGTPGGSRIITMVLLAALEFYDSKNVKAMVEKRRFHHQYLPDKLFFEPDTFNDVELSSLREMGHTPQSTDSTYGNLQAIVIEKDTGKVSAASDPRGIGRSVVLH